MPTTSISLIRIHTEKTTPPRALWVPFELGRPLGTPNAPDFQKRVLREALRLLEAPDGPVIVDFPEDAPLSTGEPVVLACPYVPPRGEETAGGDAEELCRQFRLEVTSMRTWYDRALKQRGRTMVGLSRLAPGAFADFLCPFLEGRLPENARGDVSLDYELRYTADDVKAYYYEAATAQPGADELTSTQIDAWFWNETVAGKLLRSVREVCLQSQDEAIKRTARGVLVPMKQLS